MNIKVKVKDCQMKEYGKELILDLHDCNEHMFQRKYIKIYFKELCELIDMKRAKLVFWDDVGISEKEKQTEVHTKGTSAVQFILTSNITLHTLDILQRVYVNIFSCKWFDADKAAEFTKNWFGASEIKKTVLAKNLLNGCSRENEAFLIKRDFDLDFGNGRKEKVWIGIKN